MTFERVEALAFQLYGNNELMWAAEDEATRNYWRKRAVETEVPSAFGDEQLRAEWRRMGHPNTTGMMAAILALRARVAKLEALLREALPWVGHMSDDPQYGLRPRITAALSLGGLPMENWSVHPEPTTKAYVDENSLQTPDAEKEEK